MREGLEFVPIFWQKTSFCDCETSDKIKIGGTNVAVGK